MAFPKTNSCLLLTYMLLLTACTFTTTLPKEPVFTDVPKIQQALRDLVPAELFNVVGQEITTNKKSRSELEVTITNGKNIPTTTEERSTLCYSVAKTVKSNLQDSAQFDSYRIKLLKKDESGAVTKTISVEYVFNSSDL